MASHRGGGSNRRRHQMCPGTCALPALEVPVRRGRTALPCTHHIGVHPQTHGTPCITPLRTGPREDHVQPSASACRFTAIDPGTTSVRTSGDTRRTRSTCAAHADPRSGCSCRNRCCLLYTSPSPRDGLL